MSRKRRSDKALGDRNSLWSRNTDPLVKTVDPRASDENLGKAQKAMLGLGVKTGRNTDSFDPRSTLVRPMMRVRVADKNDNIVENLKHDDVVIVPRFFCDKDDWSLYYKLVEETAKKDLISWHEGAHLVSKTPAGDTYEDVRRRMADFFGVENVAGSRFNWYKDTTDWKPMHHDSAAFNARRAKTQNCTIGVSFGSTRELAFVDAKDSSRRVYFPQENGMLFYFGRDVNIQWKHGVNFVEEEDGGGKGRISIILWGRNDSVVEERNSPPMLTDETRPVYDGRRENNNKKYAKHRR